jgi:hypothetical protein
LVVIFFVTIFDIRNLKIKEMKTKEQKIKEIKRMILETGTIVNNIDPVRLRISINSDTSTDNIRIIGEFFTENNMFVSLYKNNKLFFSDYYKYSELSHENVNIIYNVILKYYEDFKVDEEKMMKRCLTF